MTAFHPQARETDLTLRTADDHALAATCFAPATGLPDVAVLVNCATAVPRRYYARFARFLAARGALVLTYDYRGIGGSAPPALSGYDATMQDWGMRDQAAAAAWLRARHPGLSLCVVGHSFGGQALGLAPHAADYDRALLVGAQHGYWRNWPWRRWPRSLLLWLMLVPMTTRRLGFFPARRFGLGEDMPAGVARQWARWCLCPHYMCDEAGAPLRPHFAELRASVLALGFADDNFAPEYAIRRLLEEYPNAVAELRFRTPRDCGERTIGHFGYFRLGADHPLWAEAANWLFAGIAERRLPAA